MSAGSLLNIDWGSQTMGEKNLCNPAAPTLAFARRKRILAVTLSLGSCPSGALIHILLLLCDPWSCLDCKAQEVVCALGALRLC